MSDAQMAVAPLESEELAEVPEHLDEAPAVPAVAPGQAGGPLRFARMSGSSIAARDAAGWVTDFLNAAYFRHPTDERDVDDLRLAFCVLTTYWYRRDPSRPLHLGDLAAFHRAFGSHRFDTDPSAS